MMKLLFIFSLFIFFPVLKADTYYDYEIISVDKLPTPNVDTLNKVYNFENKYYITEKQESDYTPIPLNEDLKGKTIYIKDLTDYFDNVAIKHTSIYTNYADTSPSASYINNKDTIYNLCSYESSIKIYNVKTYLAVKKTNGSIEQRKSLTYDSSCVVKSWNNIFSLNDYLSLTPFETIYTWQEIDVSLVIENKVDERDFYLFYSFEDIKDFNILASYNLDNFTDFEKVIITIGFNILFICFLGLIIYIGLKVIYKALSIIFNIFS